MSIESISIALHHSRATGAAKLVLIGIANHDGDGGSWPAVSTLARYAGVDPRSVKRSISQLVELHEIRRDIQGGGDNRTAEHQRPNRYHFLLTCPPNCDRTSRHRTRPVVALEPEFEGVTPVSPGDASVTRGVTPTSPKPSSNPPSTSNKETHVPDREHGACGHLMIDDRHCERGCSAARVLEETA